MIEGELNDSDFSGAGKATEQLSPPGGLVSVAPNRIERLDEVRSYIDAIDFEMMKRKMRSTLGWSTRKLDYVERQYRNYLYLRRKYEAEKLPPSTDIDEFWHAHILDTHAYHRDVARIFGYYFHHFPYFGERGESDHQNLLSAWENTQRRYGEEFGEEIYEFEEDGD